MKGSLFQSMAWLHTWCGLIVGWLLFAIFLTGTLSVFADEISHWMRPELHRAGTAPRAELVARAEQVLRRHASAEGPWQIILPTDKEPAVELRWRQAGARIERHMDAATGELLASRDTLGGHFFVDFHYSLMAGQTGIWIVAAVTMAMLVTLISGVIIHKRIFSDFFTFRPRASGQRAWLDAHNAFGVLALPFHLMVTYTGLVISFAVYLPVGLQLFYGGSAAALRAQIVTPFERPAAHQAAELLPIASFLEPAETVLGTDTAQLIVIRNPGDAHAVVEVFRRYDDRIAAIADHVAFDGVIGGLIGSQTEWNSAAFVWRTLVGLHLAQFGGSVMRWLYFLCGLAGTFMVGSGLVLFTVKRRGRHAAEVSRFKRAVEQVNVSAVAGVVVACISFLWINRLLPASVHSREAWEVGLLLPVWLATLAHALARRPQRAWVEQLGLAALLCIALPILNAATADETFLQAMAPGRGVARGVDLTVFCCGLGLASVAWRLALRGTAAGRRAMVRANNLARHH